MVFTIGLPIGTIGEGSTGSPRSANTVESTVVSVAPYALTVRVSGPTCSSRSAASPASQPSAPRESSRTDSRPPPPRQASSVLIARASDGVVARISGRTSAIRSASAGGSVTTSAGQTTISPPKSAENRKSPRKRSTPKLATHRARPQISLRPYWAFQARRMWCTLRWLICTPLGLPVVPEV